MLKMRKLKKEFTLSKSKGFTLIELLVVIAIIAILATVVIINVVGARAKAARAKVAADMNVSIKVASACRTFDGAFVAHTVAATPGTAICTIVSTDASEIGASTGSWPTSITANGFTNAASTAIAAADTNVSIIIKAPDTSILTCTLSGCVPGAGSSGPPVVPAWQ